MRTMNRLVAAAALVLLAGPVLAQEAPEEPDGMDALDELETIVIIGGYSAPKMWKVSSGDHVMWVLGNPGPAPQGVKWRPEQVEARVAESQLVLYPGWVNAGLDIGLFKAITLIPAAFKAAKNPDNKKLKDVLSPETYVRWRVLKTTYIGRDDDIEKWRPSIAIGKLQSEVMKKIGPRSAKPPPMGMSVRSVVADAAKRHKVKVRTMPNVKREVEVKNAREILKSVRDTDIGDAKCFTQGLEYLERLIEYVNHQSNTPPPRSESCEDFLIKGLRSGEIPDPAGALKVLDDVELQSKLGRQQLDAEWLAAAQAALTKNTSTFAVVSMRDVTRPDGYLAKLRGLGYKVEEPDIAGN